MLITVLSNQQTEYVTLKRTCSSPRVQGPREIQQIQAIEQQIAYNFIGSFGVNQPWLVDVCVLFWRRRSNSVIAPKDGYTEIVKIKHDFDAKVSHLYDWFSYLFKLKCSCGNRQFYSQGKDLQGWDQETCNDPRLVVPFKIHFLLPTVRLIWVLYYSKPE